VGRFQHELEAVIATQARERRGSGPENFHAAFLERREIFPERAGPANRVLDFAVAHENGGERGERRIVQDAAEVSFLLVEGNVVLLGGVLDRVMFGIVGLDENFSGEFAASRASGNLREQLEGALGGAKVRAS